MDKSTREFKDEAGQSHWIGCDWMGWEMGEFIYRYR